MCTLSYTQYFHDFSAGALLVPSMARCQDSTKYITHSLTHNEASERQHVQTPSQPKATSVTKGQSVVEGSLSNSPWLLANDLLKTEV